MCFVLLEQNTFPDYHIWLFIAFNSISNLEGLKQVMRQKFSFNGCTTPVVGARSLCIGKGRVKKTVKRCIVFANTFYWPYKMCCSNKK